MIQSIPRAMLTDNSKRKYAHTWHSWHLLLMQCNSLTGYVWKQWRKCHICMSWLLHACKHGFHDKTLSKKKKTCWWHWCRWKSRKLLLHILHQYGVLTLPGAGMPLKNYKALTQSVLIKESGLHVGCRYLMYICWSASDEPCFFIFINYF